MPAARRQRLVAQLVQKRLMTGWQQTVASVLATLDRDRAERAADGVSYFSPAFRTSLMKRFQPKAERAIARALGRRFASAYSRLRVAMVMTERSTLTVRAPTVAQAERLAQAGPDEFARVRAAIIGQVLADHRADRLLEENRRYLRVEVVQARLDARVADVRAMLGEGDAFEEGSAVEQAPIQAQIQEALERVCERRSRADGRAGAVCAVGAHVVKAVRARARVLVRQRFIRTGSEVRLAVRVQDVVAAIQRAPAQHIRARESVAVFAERYRTRYIGSLIAAHAAKAPPDARAAFTRALETIAREEAQQPALDAALRKALEPALEKARSTVAENQLAQVFGPLASRTYVPPEALVVEARGNPHYKIPRLFERPEIFTAGRVLRDAPLLVETREAVRARAHEILRGHACRSLARQLKAAEEAARALPDWIGGGGRISREALIARLVAATGKRWQKIRPRLWPPDEAPAAHAYTDLWDKAKAHCELLVLRALKDRMQEDAEARGALPSPEKAAERAAGRGAGRGGGSGGGTGVGRSTGRAHARIELRGGPNGHVDLRLFRYCEGRAFETVTVPLAPDATSGNRARLALLLRPWLQAHLRRANNRPLKLGVLVLVQGGVDYRGLWIAREAGKTAARRTKGAVRIQWADDLLDGAAD